MLKRNLVLGLCIIFTAINGYSQRIEKTVTILQPKSDTSRYYYVPFEVPAGTKSLCVSYTYDKKNGENVLDLGLFDSGFDETEKTVGGFRGWSGGRRGTIFVGENTATNGYLPGKIPEGKWRVVLGLYKVVAEGVEVKITVRLNEVDKQAEAERISENATTFNFEKTARQSPVTANDLTWYRGDLHMHSFNSDGSWTLASFLEYADLNNLDFVGVTDHNTTAHHAPLSQLAEGHPGLLVMLGEEVTTYGGHFNVWGLPAGTLIDFRVTPGDTRRLTEVVSQIHDLGLPASINHPTALCGGCSWNYGDDWTNMDSVEVWNGSWDPTDEMALNKWDALLQKGSRIPAIGSSDSHMPPTGKSGSPIGLPVTFVGSTELTQSAILSAIKDGRIFVSERSDQFISITAGKTGIGSEIKANPGTKVKVSVTTLNYPPDAKLRLISDGKVLQETTLGKGKYSADIQFDFQKSTYLGAEVRGENNKMLGFTNPILIIVK